MSDVLLQQYGCWTRLISCLTHFGRPTLNDILHDRTYSQLSRDPKQLYNQLNTIHIKELRRLRKKGVIKEDQWKLLFPASKETDSTNFDISLCRTLIEACTNIPPPVNGWRSHPVKGDTSDAAYVLRLVALRNKLHHPTFLTLSDAEFNTYWNKLKKYLYRLGCTKDIQHLKTSPLDCLGMDYVKAKQDMEKLENGSNVHFTWKFVVRSIAIVFIGILGVYYVSSGDDKNVKEASDLLRQYYLEGIGKEHIESINGQTISRKRFYVDLAVVDSLDVDINNTHSAREFHIKQMLSQKGKCTMENLLEEENQIVLLRGIGGIGKSFMVQTMALNWAEKRIWKNFQFVFLFKFREMNLVRNISSLSDLVLKKYPLLFTKIKFTDLVPVSKKIIFIMDGLDEFSRVEDLHIISKQESDNVSDISKVIFETINPHNALMPGHKTIITSRPNACPVLRKSFSTASIKQVDILGFSSEQVLDYINVFSGSDTKLGNLLRKKIDESKQLQLLSRIPVFLWTICSLYQEQRLLHAPKTTTELFVWQLTLFLHRHYKTRPSNQLTSNVFDIFKEKCVQKVVFSLSFLAQKMLTDGVILIDVADIPKEIRNENIEATGLVSKLRTMDGLKYQFNHLLMQEFLTAVYYFFPEGKHKNDITSNPSLSGCLPLVCGLHGALKVKSESSSILKQFVKNMGLVQHGINPLNNLLRTKNPQLLQGIFEYQNNLSEKIIQQCKLKSDCSDLFLTVDASHTQSELVYFLEKYRNDFNVLGITFEPNQGGVSCVVGLSKIMSDICSVSRFVICSNSFDQGSLKYLVTSIHNCSKNSVITSKWYSIFFVYWGEDFDRDYGEVTQILFDTLLLYKQVHLHVRSHSRRVIYDLRKSIMRNKNEMRLEKLHLDIRAIKPYFCEMLAEILLRVKDVEVQKTRSAFYRFSDEEVDCLKQTMDKLLKEIQTKSKFLNGSTYLVLVKLVIQNWELQMTDTSWIWKYKLNEKTSNLPFETNAFEGWYIALVLLIQTLPLFLILLCLYKLNLTQASILIDREFCAVLVAYYFVYSLVLSFVTYKSCNDGQYCGEFMSM
ncbi:uncharacterized protein LOC130629132 [Hydractinia symbiolongicarpus]|uniref:uncharacterized protein LOC130629132 n=1 Tax=Hydractinia symbiolongicarpus TaxID=13093 RepID=UPI0025512CC7|nr:uncharacterized protein LOC130629132 [Hydractinia symbiolongicarpus]